MNRFRALYGASPLHLLLVLCSFALTGYAGVRLLGGAEPWKVVIWFAGAALLHDLVLLPLYTVTDRAAQTVLGERREPAAAEEAGRPGRAVDQPRPGSGLPLRPAAADVLPADPGTGERPLHAVHHALRRCLPRALADHHGRPVRSVRRGPADPDEPLPPSGAGHRHTVVSPHPARPGTSRQDLLHVRAARSPAR